MTPLQQMAFERLEILNKECQSILPERYNPNDAAISLPTDDVQKLRDRLWEQENWLEALRTEEQRDGFEETI